MEQAVWRSLSPPFARFCAPTYDFGLISCAIARCWASTLARGAIMQELMPTGPECNRAFSAAGHFKASSRKSRRSAQRRSGAVPLRRCEGPLVAQSGRSWIRTVLRCRFAKCSFEQRWSVWAAAFGGSQRTDGNAIVGSNDTRSSLYGTAVGADYLFSPNTIAGFALVAPLCCGTIHDVRSAGLCRAGDYREATSCA